MGERNEGDDIAGFVDKVGSNVTEFHPGDRIAAFHIPNTTSFEESAAIPFAAMTAAIGIYIRLGLYLIDYRKGDEAVVEDNQSSHPFRQKAHVRLRRH